MLNVCCVCVGDAYSQEYVVNLFAMVRRNLKAGLRGRFIVFTDNPALEQPGIEIRYVPNARKSWWAKLELFKPDAFPKGERVLYFDLDTVIVGSLDAIAEYSGKFAILRDFYRPDGLQSSVMAWEAGALDFVYSEWLAAGCPEPAGGDQEWIEKLVRIPIDLWQLLHPLQFVSYKVHCKDGIPDDAKVVVFHGRPKPHECLGWVPKVWNADGGSANELVFACNSSDRERRANVAESLRTAPKWLQMRDGLKQPALIVGGGPSLESELWRIRGYRLSGCPVFATNNAAQYLLDAGVPVDGHVVCDARAENAAFVPDNQNIICYYASQTHVTVRAAAGTRLVCWHRHSDGYQDIIGQHDSGTIQIGGGSTVGLQAISVAYVLGHRNFILFGMDSSYADGAHHAYQQSLNDGEPIITAKVGEPPQEFQCAPWMIQQVEEFTHLAEHMTAIGCQIMVHGTGLLPYVANNLSAAPNAKDLRAQAILTRLSDIANPVGAEIGVFMGDLSKRLLARSDLTLYMVDAWAEFHKHAYDATGDFHAHLTQQQQDMFYSAARQTVYFARSRAKIIRKDSVEAAREVPDGSLDFVFIDADHSYEGCRADILAWSPKVKRGGLISGHDYENTEFPRFGVKRAVDELFKSVELGDNYTWFVRRE